MKKVVSSIFFLTAIICYASSNSQLPPIPTTASASSEAKPTIEQTLTTCAACHGANGNSVNPLWPNLAGQHASYLLKELIDIKQNKERQVPVMTAVVASLNQNDLIALANLYADKPLAQGKTPLKYLHRGQELYRGGDMDKHITACIACHGPRGLGNGEAKFPILSGQNAEYTIKTLEDFQNNTRKNDLNSIMRDISHRMSKEDIEAVAYYIQGLH